MQGLTRMIMMSFDDWGRGQMRVTCLISLMRVYLELIFEINKVNFENRIGETVFSRFKNLQSNSVPLTLSQGNKP